VQRGFSHLLAFRANCLAEEIDSRWLDDYNAWRREQPDARHLRRKHLTDKPTKIGCSVATLNRELAALRHAFKLASRHEPPLVTRTPTIKLAKERNRRMGFFEWADFEAIREHLPDALKPIMTTAFFTGWRTASELCTRERKHVVDGSLVIERDATKNEEPKRFPLDAIPELRETIERQLEATRQLEVEKGRVIPWLFHRNGKQIRDYSRAWHSACRAAGLAGRIPHDFRPTAARNLINAGVDPYTTMQLVGWTSETMLRRYNIFDDDTLKRGAEKLAGEVARLKQKPAKVVAIR
jgi:integrase